MADSESETLALSDSDRESDYVTGVEDFPDATPKKKKEEEEEEEEEWVSRGILSSLSDLSHTSSFVQDILYEDSRVEIAVVDLFVAVKTVKDNLEFLTKCNNMLFDKINNFSERTGVIRKEFRDLLENMQRFKAKMNTDARIFNLHIPQRKSANIINISDHSTDSDGRKNLPNIEVPSPKEAEEEVTSKRKDETIIPEQILRESVYLESGPKSFGKDFNGIESLCQSCKEKDIEKRESARACSECGRNKFEKEKAKTGCLECLMSALKNESPSQLPVLTEALLGSFLASLLWLRKGSAGAFPRSRSSKSSSSISKALVEKKESDEMLNLRESTVQMICEICEILSGATLQELELKEPPQILKDAEKADENLQRSSMVKPDDPRKLPDVKAAQISEAVNLKSSRTVNEGSCLYCGTSLSPHCPSCGKESVVKTRSRDSFKSILETKDDTSEGESDFEEALTEPLAQVPHCELKAKPSVTCMGDLTKTVMGKKSASTLTPENNEMSSWVGKLSDEIRSKARPSDIKKIKPKTNIRVFEQPFRKSEKALKLAGALQFTVRANTSMGVFDVTVVQYKKRRNLTDYKMKHQKAFSNFPSGSNRTRDSHLSSDITNLKNDCWSSEDSLHNSDSEVEAGSNSGEDDLEEFLEIFVENSKKKKNGEVVPRPEKGISKKVSLKADKSHFFEIQKCCSVYFVQEIIQKTAKKQPEPPEPEKYGNSVHEELISLNMDDKRQKQVILQGSSGDLVIYIQVEVEGGPSSSPNGLFVEYQTTSLATQTTEKDSENFSLSNERIIKLDEEEGNGESLYYIWREREGVDGRERVTFDETNLMTEGKHELEITEEEWSVDEEKVIEVKDLKEKAVTFNEELSEFYIEREVQDEDKEESKLMSTSSVVIMKEPKRSAHIWFPQKVLWQRIEITRLQEIPEAVADIMKAISTNAIELEKALNLIREIEDDIMNVKLGDAMSILPELESELRKHLQSKMKVVKEKEIEAGVSEDNFFSAVDFWYNESEQNSSSEVSEERLNNLLKLLSNLEEVVRSNEYSHKQTELCENNSSKIYRLLHALTVSIRELEERPNLTSLSQTLDIASQLDIAVRDYDRIIKSQPLDYVVPKDEFEKWNSSSKSFEEIQVTHHLKNVRKKVFEIVETEAIDVEKRIERDFERLDRLERENDEAMMFLETFLQKTERRVAELSNLKVELQKLSSELSILYKNLQDSKMQKEEEKTEGEEEISQPREAEENVSSDFASDLSAETKETKEEPVRETVSGLLSALDNLKLRAREKNQICKEIFYSSGFEKAQDSENTSRRSSRSSFTAKHIEKLISSVKEFKRIGQTSLFLSWTKPEGPLKDSTVGYEIHVNGKVNQKVRNPQRLQAVLYSIDFSKKTQVQLYAVTESSSKILLATIGYQDK